MITNVKYREYLVDLSWHDFEVNCPYPYVMERLQKAFTYNQFLIECDFMAFGLPLNPENYTDKDWESIGDWVDECGTPEFDYSLIY